MLEKPEPIAAALRAGSADALPASMVILVTPQGRPLTQRIARGLAEQEQIILLCGRYEGVDERVRPMVDMELSIGDYVLTGGEAARA